MNELEEFIVRFYEDVRLTVQERSEVNKKLVALQKSASNLGPMFELLQIQTGRNDQVYFFAASSIEKIICFDFGSFNEQMKVEIRDRLFECLKEFQKFPQLRLVVNKLLSAMACLIVRTTDLWRNSLDDIGTFTLMIEPPEVGSSLFMKSITYIADQVGKVPTTEQKNVRDALKVFNPKVINFLLTSMPRLTGVNIEDGFKALQHWIIRLEVDDIGLQSQTIEALLNAMVREDQCKYAEDAICEIFTDPFFEGCEEVFKHLITQMLVKLRGPFEAALKQQNTEQLDSFFLLFVEIGSFYSEILQHFSAQDIQIYCELVFHATPACLKSSSVMLDFWTAMFRATDHPNVATVMNETFCKQIVTQQLTLAKYSTNFGELDEEEQQEFQRFHQEERNFFINCRNKVPFFSDLLLLYAHEGRSLFAQNPATTEWCTLLEVALFFISTAMKNKSTVVQLFDVISDIPIEQCARFHPLLVAIKDFVEQFATLSDEMLPNTLKIIVGIFKTQDAKLVKESLKILDNLISRHNLCSFSDDLLNMFDEAINRSNFPAKSKIHFVSTLCRFICSFGEDTASNIFQRIITPFIDTLTDHVKSQSGNLDAGAAVNLLKTYSTIFSVLNNDMFAHSLFQLYDALHPKLNVLIPSLSKNEQFIGALCLLHENYILNLKKLAAPHFSIIGNILGGLYGNTFAPEFLITFRVIIVELYDREKPELCQHFIQCWCCITEITLESIITARDPELFVRFYNSVYKFERAGIRLPYNEQQWKEVYLTCLGGIRFNEPSVVEEATCFVRMCNDSQNSNIVQIFNDCFQQLVDIIISRLADGQLPLFNIPRIADLLYRLKMSKSSLLFPALSQCSVRMLPEEKNKLLQLLPACRSPRSSIEIVEKFVIAHQTIQ